MCLIIVLYFAYLCCCFCFCLSVSSYVRTRKVPEHLVEGIMKAYSQVLEDINNAETSKRTLSSKLSSRRLDTLA